MTGTKCCVVLCKSNTSQTRNVSWHVFPVNRASRKIWIDRVKAGCMKFGSWTPSPNAKICGFHFNLHGRRQDEPFPRYFPRKTFREISSRNICSKLNIVQDNECGPVGAEVTIPDIPVTDANLNLQHVMFPRYENLHQNNKQHKGQYFIDNDHNYTLPSSCALINKREQLCETVENLNKQVEDQKQLITSLRAQIKIERRKKTPSQKDAFIVTDIIEDNAQLHFYTGFKHKDAFMNFANFIKCPYEVAKSSLNDFCEGKARRPMKLDFIQQLFLVLCRLRLGLLESDLAYRFNVCQGTISTIWCFWIDLLATQLTQIPIWPSRILVDKYMPESFKDLYPRTRVILDCTEIYIQTPSDFRVQSDTYSSYKSHNTAKGLVGITPNGFISFVSDLYGGRVSDRAIVENCGILDKLEENDHVMADRGFTIDDLLSQKKVFLNIPPFLDRSRNVFSEVENQTTKDIATLRIHIERIMKHIKTFRILQGAFPNTMSTKLNEIWKTCCYLLNFMREPLLEN